jgi:hypothetical protein
MRSGADRKTPELSRPLFLFGNIGSAADALRTLKIYLHQDEATDDERGG